MPKGVFIPGSGRDPFNIPESQIRYAMENTRSNAEAARFLSVATSTYKKYATMYKDPETGKTLYESHKNQAGKQISRPNSGRNHGTPIDAILEGKHPEYPRKQLKRRLQRTGDLGPLMCTQCSFDEKRITDDKSPILLHWIDGDTTNHHRDNLEWLCYNCYFVTVGNFTGKKEKYWYGGDGSISEDNWDII